MPPAWGVAATVGGADCAALGALGWLREAMWALTCLMTSGAALMTSGATAVTMGTAATHPHMSGAVRRTRGRASFIARTIRNVLLGSRLPLAFSRQQYFE